MKLRNSVTCNFAAFTVVCSVLRESNAGLCVCRCVIRSPTMRSSKRLHHHHHQQRWSIPLRIRTWTRVHIKCTYRCRGSSCCREEAQTQSPTNHRCSSASLTAADESKPLRRTTIRPERVDRSPDSTPPYDWPWEKSSRSNRYKHTCTEDTPLSKYPLDHLTTYMTYFLYLVQVFKWGWDHKCV